MQLTFGSGRTGANRGNQPFGDPDCFCFRQVGDELDGDIFEDDLQQPGLLVSELAQVEVVFRSKLCEIEFVGQNGGLVLDGESRIGLNFRNSLPLTLDGDEEPRFRGIGFGIGAESSCGE